MVPDNYVNEKTGVNDSKLSLCNEGQMSGYFLAENHVSMEVGYSELAMGDDHSAVYASCAYIALPNVEKRIYASSDDISANEKCNVLLIF